MKGEVQRIWYKPETEEYIVEGFAGAQRTNLVCDTETKIVYYLLNNGYMSPYFGEHGRLCRLLDNHQIVEFK